ncbi:MAG TPA: histidine phosphatase family protein [Phenylobacterium sp.]|uniref:histidine phosphatase family protein n=1 Tax=Phenylobacterium sp. TaxID=1871053 RepID=UPI002B972E54|nr:histidine phosphatase family protein [Phenylobacterium sp.]HSV01612.1 histidine phosphatase family protein [Phenylobacterium sp.]
MIYLVRHGETEFNVARRWQGAQDSPLTPLGVRQAEAMAARLTGLVAAEPGGWRLVASPLGRARATAAIIGERLGLAASFDERLREHSIGALDGHAVEEVLPFLPQGRPRHERHFHVPGAESFESMTARIGAFLAEVTPDDRLIAVSHGAAGRVFRGVYAGLGKAEMLTLKVPQDAIFRLEGGRIQRIDCAPVVS